MARSRISRRGLFGILGSASAVAALPTEPAQEKNSGQPSIGRIVHPQSKAEKEANVAPTDYSIDPELLDPRRYGAVGDGLLDDSEALNAWVDVVNASINPVSTWPSGRVFVSGLMRPITARNLTWNCWSTLRSKPGSIIGTKSWITVSSHRLRIAGLTLDGDQAHHATSAGNALLYLNGVTDLLLQGCSFSNSWMKGVVFFQVKGGRITDCHFDYNANLGIELNAASDLHFTGCSVDYNGWGFHRTFSTNAVAAFGAALRFRSHHVTFTDCTANQNGRDGFCTNQGSYGIKYIGCIAWMNGDGGFTLAADNTGSGLAGEGEACCDCEFLGCEAYNNWSSGLAAYAPAHNITVDGGRYYNNNRVAGEQVLASSYFNGIYFTAGSSAIRVRAKTYDDRQVCTITGVTAGNVEASGWVPGTLRNYPRVALYDASLAFQGYATISIEAAGSLKITSCTHNGVTLDKISSGWWVSQRMQHNGVFFDNGVQGSIDVDAFGFMPGPAGYSGFKSVAGYFGNNQNVLLPGAAIDATELLVNPSWEENISHWTFSMGNGSATHYTAAGPFVRSAGAVQMIGGRSVGLCDGNLISSAVNHAQRCFIEASVWSHAIGRGDATAFLYWDPGTGPLFTQVTHPGGGWRQLKIGIFVGAGNKRLILRLAVQAGKTVYFDNASLRTKSESTDDRDYKYPARMLAT